MEKTLGAIARFLEGELIGNPETVITGCASIEDAKQGDLTFARDAKNLQNALSSYASAILIPPSGEIAQEQRSSGKTFVRVSNPRLAFAKALGLFDERKPLPPGIHPTAQVGEGVQLGSNAAIGAYAVIEDGAQIGDNVQIAAFCFVGNGSLIGEDTVLRPRVTLMDSVKVGKRCLLHSGCVIGSDGFGFEFDQGRFVKIPQIGRVEIGDDVEIGANTTIDRAVTGVTRIGNGAKIDNLVQIAHNVQVGSHVVLAGQVGVAGSTIIEDYAVLGGQVGLADHIRIGKGAQIGAQSGVISNVPAGEVFWGLPARPRQETLTALAYQRKLAGLFERVKQLENRLNQAAEPEEMAVDQP